MNKFKLYLGLSLVLTVPFHAHSMQESHGSSAVRAPSKSATSLGTTRLQSKQAQILSQWFDDLRLDESISAMRQLKGALSSLNTLAALHASLVQIPNLVAERFLRHGMVIRYFICLEIALEATYTTLLVNDDHLAKMQHVRGNLAVFAPIDRFFKLSLKKVHAFAHNQCATPAAHHVVNVGRIHTTDTPIARIIQFVQEDLPQCQRHADRVATFIAKTSAWNEKIDQLHNLFTQGRFQEIKRIKETFLLEKGLLEAARRELLVQEEERNDEAFDVEDHNASRRPSVASEAPLPEFDRLSISQATATATALPSLDENDGTFAGCAAQTDAMETAIVRYTPPLHEVMAEELSRHMAERINILHHLVTRYEWLLAMHADRQDERFAWCLRALYDIRQQLSHLPHDMTELSTVMGMNRLRLDTLTGNMASMERLLAEQGTTISLSNGIALQACALARLANGTIAHLTTRLGTAEQTVTDLQSLVDQQHEAYAKDLAEKQKSLTTLRETALIERHARRRNCCLTTSTLCVVLCGLIYLYLFINVHLYPDYYFSGPRPS